MARSSKYLYYKKQDGTSGCVPLYTNTDCFSCVAGYYKPLGVKCGSETYYVPTMSTEIPSNPSGMRYQDYYVDRVNYKEVSFSAGRCTLYYNRQYPVNSIHVGYAPYLTEIACFARYFWQYAEDNEYPSDIWEKEEYLSTLPSRIYVHNVRCVTKAPDDIRDYTLVAQSYNSYKIVHDDFKILHAQLCVNSYVTYQGGSVDY